MAGDVIYADLNLAEGRGPPSSNAHKSPPCPHWHGVALKAGSAGLLLLLVTVAGLGVWAATRGSDRPVPSQTRAWASSEAQGLGGQSHTECSCNTNSRADSHTEQVFQGSLSKEAEGSAKKGDGVTSSTSSGRACNDSLENLSRLKQSVCDPAQIHSTGGAGCKLCPGDWWLHGDKCYWLSKELKNWSESREDCAKRGSEMLVIRNQAQMDHLHPALPRADRLWIGSTFNSSQRKWTWLDGAPVQEQLRFPEVDQEDAKVCGVLEKSKIDFDSCSAKLKWLCQKAAFLL